MSRFKLFFGIAVGMILFFFLAKVVFIAFIIAVLMSVVFGVFSKAKHFFQQTFTEEYEAIYNMEDSKESRQPIWKEDLFTETPIRGVVYLDNHRQIIVQ